MREVLPDGCPFVIGGGLVRDGLLGGRPSDIDVWLPSNILIPDVTAFGNHIRIAQMNAEVRLVFSGPGAHTRGLLHDIAPVVPGEYGDVNNHWVYELEYPDMPKVNFMRSMTPWENNPQAFFDGLMRAFDIDHCMYFVGYMPGQNTVSHVIMPQHLAAVYASHSGRFTGAARLNELYWNKYRFETTSRERINARVVKMASKYLFRNRTMEETIAMGLMLELSEIQATAVPLSVVMRHLDRAPSPQQANRLNPRPQVNIAFTPEEIRNFQTTGRLMWETTPTGQFLGIVPTATTTNT